VFANAFTANSTVTNCPLSPDVSAPICFAPLLALIFQGHYTAVTPITSRFYANYHLLGMYEDQSLQMVHQVYKLVALAKLVFVLIKHYFTK